MKPEAKIFCPQNTQNTQTGKNERPLFLRHSACSADKNLFPFVRLLCLFAAIGNALVNSTFGQGTFQNLDFEQANPVNAGSPYPPGYITVANAFPDWNVYYGNTQQTVITYNAPGTGSTLVSLIGPGAFVPAIDGSYSVILEGGGTASAASINQSGLIPAFAQSLLFKAQPGKGAMNVLIGSQIVPFAAVGNGPNYTLYGANISPWAGQSEQLEFSALQDLSILNNWLVDDIQFSATPVPEPGTWALLVCGGALFGIRRLKSKHRTSNIEHRTSNIEHRTSNIEHRTSNIEHRTSNAEHRINANGKANRSLLIHAVTHCLVTEPRHSEIRQKSGIIRVHSRLISMVPARRGHVVAAEQIKFAPNDKWV